MLTEIFIGDAFIEMSILNRLRFLNTIFAISSVLAIAVIVILKWQDGAFSNSGFMPHGHCYLWTPSLVWLMVLSDLLIGLAYVSISICLYVLVRRIRLPFSAIFLAFGAFIAACGGTHFMEIYTLWYPNYWLAGMIKVITAIASVTTAAILFPLFSKVVQFATSARLSEERKKQLEAANIELNRREQDLLLVNRELEAFSYSVAHDLRSPLRGINGFSEALKEDYAAKLDAQGREYLDFISAGSQRMGKIIDDLLGLSKVTRQELVLRDVNLSQYAKEAIETFRALDPGRVIDVFVQEGATVRGDSGLLRIVIENLVSNAWKFTNKTVGARLEFGVKLEAGRKIFFVRDNGAGFDMKYSSKLFGAFQRLHSNEDYEGTGIGLATASRILARHGGEIWVESEVGQGTTFYFVVEGRRDA